MNRVRPVSHPAAATRTIHRFLATSTSLAVMAISSLCSEAAASSTSYNFVETGSGNVLATLELSSLPATHTDVVSLEFTAAGDAIFGVLGTYTGLFDLTNDSFVDDGEEGLAGSGGGTSAAILDTDPLLAGIELFALFAHRAAGFDAIVVVFTEAEPSIDQLIADGDWRLVPEPATLILFVVGAVLVGFGVGRRRTRDVR